MTRVDKDIFLVVLFGIFSHLTPYPWPVDTVILLTLVTWAAVLSFYEKR